MLTVENKVSAKTEKGIELSEKELFSFAEYDPDAGERTGYSNYSYWRSTLRSFLRNKAAMVLTVVLVILLLFALIQPALPGQRKAKTINDNPVTRMQMSDLAPSWDNTYMTAPAGTLLKYMPLADFEGWYAVKNELGTIDTYRGNDRKQRHYFDVLEFADDWCKVEYNGISGYIRTPADLDNWGKVPDDPYSAPFNTYSYEDHVIYSEKDGVVYASTLPNSDGWLYVKASELDIIDENTAAVPADTSLRMYPSTIGFLFGTNAKGQDLWASVWSGTRTSLYIGFMVALVEAFVGIIVGIIWGYVRALDRLLTEIYNVLDNIPTTIVLILIAYVSKPSVTTLILAMCLTRWMGMARFIRNQIIIIRDRDYNLASRCLGAGTTQIMLKNLLPYMVSVIMLRMALAIPGAIGSEVFITYIGLGLPTDTPSLGNLINKGRANFVGNPALAYQLIFPTIVLSIITIAFYVIGNAFADAADPRNHL